MSELLGFSISIGLLAAYFLPAIIAGMRGHPHTVAITVLTLFVGWTVLGWIALAAWALIDTNEQQIRRQQHDGD